MFCSSCGKQIADGSKFCSFCGATQPTIANGQVVTTAPMPTSIPEPAPVIKPVGEKQKKLGMRLRETAATLDELLPIEKQIAEDEKYVQGVKTGKIQSTFIKGYYPFLICGGVCFLVIACGGCLIGGFLGNALVVVISIGVGALLLGAFTLIGLPFGQMIQKNRQQKLEEAVPIKEANLQKNLERRKQLLTDSFWETIEIVPESYRYSFAMNTIAGYFENGRADSMKEALNLFETEKHQWRMEEIQIQQAAQITNQLNSIRRSSAISAGANVANAIYNYNS